jgi:hypothetical protein
MFTKRPNWVNEVKADIVPDSLPDTLDSRNYWGYVRKLHGLISGRTPGRCYCNKSWVIKNIEQHYEKQTNEDESNKD